MSKKNRPKNVLPSIHLALLSAIAAKIVNIVTANAQYNAALQEQSEPRKAVLGKTSDVFFKRSGSGTESPAPAIEEAIDFEDVAETFIENNCPYIAAEDDPDKRFYITQSVNIGRYPHNDIQILDRSVSRIHCRIYVREGRYYIINMGATTPLNLNAREVDNYKPDTESELFNYELHDGDVITIGRLTYRFRASAAGDTRTAAFNKGNSTILLD